MFNFLSDIIQNNQDVFHGIGSVKSSFLHNNVLAQGDMNNWVVAYVGDCQAGASLPPGHPPEPSLVLHDAVGHTHLAAKGGQEKHDLQKQKHYETSGFLSDCRAEETETTQLELIS